MANPNFTLQGICRTSLPNDLHYLEEAKEEVTKTLQESRNPQERREALEESRQIEEVQRHFSSKRAKDILPDLLYETSITPYLAGLKEYEDPGFTAVTLKDYESVAYRIKLSRQADSSTESGFPLVQTFNDCLMAVVVNNDLEMIRLLLSNHAYTPAVTQLAHNLAAHLGQNEIATYINSQEKVQSTRSDETHCLTSQFFRWVYKKRNLNALSFFGNHHFVNDVSNIMSEASAKGDLETVQLLKPFCIDPQVDLLNQHIRFHLDNGNIDLAFKTFYTPLMGSEILKAIIEAADHDHLEVARSLVQFFGPTLRYIALLTTASRSQYKTSKFLIDNGVDANYTLSQLPYFFSGKNLKDATNTIKKVQWTNKIKYISYGIGVIATITGIVVCFFGNQKN